MNRDSIAAYEKHAREFLECRDKSEIGTRVAEHWARSLPPQAEVIEIACGGGLPVTRILINSGLKLWAIDSSPSLLSVFRERFPGIATKCDPVLDSDFFKRKYDAAIAIGLIFLLDENDQPRMLRRVSEILRPEASFLFTAPTEVGTWTDINTGHTCRSLGREMYESTLTSAGFRVAALHQDSGRNNYYEAEKVADPE